MHCGCFPPGAALQFVLPENTRRLKTSPYPGPSTPDDHMDYGKNASSPQNHITPRVPTKWFHV